MQTHELKTWPEYFHAVRNGQKTFELRRDDRNFKVGDEILLRSYLPDFKGGIFDGNQLSKRITYILRDAPQFGLMDGFCILGLGDV
jgi:ASC-1-like (ASCH) protein